jgi:alkanesulfonate monooxygenase SsuD/methylene tetrahydromethanopterin reductase-like flavin-dependent oxidoreductase (luciferase family)
MTSPAKPVGIALSGVHLAVLLADPVLTGRLNDSGLPFAIAGVDQVDLALPHSGDGLADGAVESSVVAATLAAWAPDLGWLAVAAVHHDHPYNLARRIASVDYLSGGRSGLVLGQRDRSALSRYSGRGASSWDGLAPGLPASAETTRTTAAAIRALWQEWSAEVPVAGRPLPVGASRQGTPVLAWRAESTGEAAAARHAADVLIWPTGSPDRLAAIAAARGDGPQLFLEIPVGGGNLSERLAAHLADERVDGVVLRPERNEAALREFTAEVLPRLADSGVFRTGWSGTLRQRLSLPVPEALAAAAQAVLPGPASEPEFTRVAVPVP